MIERFFVLNYEPHYDVGPPYLSGELNHSEYKWGVFCLNPHAVSIVEEYIFTVTDKDVKNINFDFYGEQSHLVSDRFLCLNDELGVDYRPVPVTVMMPDGKPSKKCYFYFLPGTYISLLDQECSSYSVEINVETGEPLVDNLFPGQPVYEKIERFLTKKIATPNLFVCTEILRLVCTDRFRKAAEERGLLGMSFTPLDESYIYDPWAGW